jgi:hypothetical protein
MPNYYKYQLKLEKWLCEHSERRYTFDYYAERMTEPYDPRTRKGHGLSPRTMVL